MQKGVESERLGVCVNLLLDEFYGQQGEWITK